MNKLSTLTAIAALVIVSSTSMAQTIWNGPKMTFSKTALADWTLEENQDRITDNVWITRANRMGIFNIKNEADYTSGDSPDDTEWAFGTSANLSSLTFESWEDTHGSDAPSIVDQDMVVHLITDDVYIDIKFTEWGRGAAGGGAFTYERSTSEPATGASEAAAANEVTVFPNPSSEYIQLSGLEGQTTYRMFDMLGAEVMNGTTVSNQEIDVQTLPAGQYFLTLANGQTLKVAVSK